MDDYRIDEALGYISSEIQHIDRKITEEEPFKVIKKDIAQGESVNSTSCSRPIFSMAKCPEPFSSRSCREDRKAIKENKNLRLSSHVKSNV
jgi:hypothetical protein